MKNKIMICLLLFCLCAATGIEAETIDIEDDDISIEDIYVQAKMTNADSDATIKLYVWIVVNEEATTHADLRANITVDDETCIGEKIVVNDHTISQTVDPNELAVNYEERAFVYEDYEQFVDGTHTVRVEFVDFKNDAKATNNYREVTFTSPSEWYGVVTNGLWSVLYTMDGAFDDAGEATGLGFIGEMPTVPILVAIIAVLLIYIAYRRYKKKNKHNSSKKRVQMRPRSYQDTTYRPPYQPPHYPPY